MRTLVVKCRFRFVVFIAVLCLSVSSVSAIPLSQYNQSLDDAISRIDSIFEKDEDESDAEFEARCVHTIDTIRSELPQSQPVEFDGESWTADNTWLHTALDEALRVPVAERSDKLVSLQEQLRAIYAHTHELENAKTADNDKIAAKQRLESILERSEYASGPGGQSALGRLIHDIIVWLQKWLPQSSGMAPGNAKFISGIVYILVVAGATALIVYIGWLLFNRFRRPLKLKVRKKREARVVLGERLQPEQTASDLLSEAEALARSGDLRAAIRKGYIALLVELGDRNVISLAQHKTNRDYLRSVSNLPQLHPPLKKLTESFERHWYGFVQASPNDWQDFRAGYREALQTGN